MPGIVSKQYVRFLILRFANEKLGLIEKLFSAENHCLFITHLFIKTSKNTLLLL